MPTKWAQRRTRACRTSARAARSRPPRRVLRALSALGGAGADRDLPGQNLGLVLPWLLVPLPAPRGELRPLPVERERRRRRFLRARGRLPVRARRRVVARPEWSVGPAQR